MEPEKNVEVKWMWDIKAVFKDKPEVGSRILQPHKAEAVSPVSQGMNQEGFGKILKKTPGYIHTTAAPRCCFHINQFVQYSGSLIVKHDSLFNKCNE